MKTKRKPQLNTESPKEIEFKYSADKISLRSFSNFCKKSEKDKGFFLFIEGTDYFYGKKQDPNVFFRHRLDNKLNQLTYKKKLIEDNNYIRIEHNIDLPKDMSISKVASFCKDLDFFYNTCIEKRAWIFSTNKYTAVYYICYSIDNCGSRTELGRFVELEISEDYNWKNDKQAYSVLCRVEKKYKPLGVSPKQRLKKSLWEMYKK